jgi:hypothetical protein
LIQNFNIIGIPSLKSRIKGPMEEDIDEKAGFIHPAPSGVPTPFTNASEVLRMPFGFTGDKDTVSCAALAD